MAKYLYITEYFANFAEKQMNWHICVYVPSVLAIPDNEHLPPKRHLIIIEEQESVALATREDDYDKTKISDKKPNDNG